MELVLSLFTGAGLLDRGFREAGFCVVSAGDIITGQDVREFAPARHIFKGVIGGSPCQEFSGAFRGKPTGISLEMFHQFCRIVRESECDWFLLENVPTVPNVVIDGYTVQRLNINARECGLKQNRLRCFQFGSRDGSRISPIRIVTEEPIERCCMATEGRRSKRRGFADFCELQGLPRDFLKDSDLPLRLKYKIVGNGVPVPMARVLAAAIQRRHDTKFARLCICGCGRTVRPGQTQAEASCRKRMERKRKRDTAGSALPGAVTPGQSLPLFPKLPISTEQLSLT